MRRLLLATCLLAPVHAFALSDPVAGPLDSRVRIVDYKPMQVVRLCSTGLTPLTIVLDDGERAGMMAGLLVAQKPDEAKDWYVQTAGNMVTLQPLHDMPVSVLSFGGVTADKTLRPYQFELCTRKGDIADQRDTDAYMTVRFRYAPVKAPADPTAVEMARLRQEAARDAAADRAARIRLAAAGAALPRNQKYDKRGEGCPVLAASYPDRPFVWDDGIRTTLSFPPHATLPAVFVLNQDGKEAVQTPISTDTAVGLEVMLPTVYRYIRLRRGGQVCELRNDAFDPLGTQPSGGTGTISPDVSLEARASQ